MKRMFRLSEVLIEAMIFLVLNICLHEYAHIQVLQFFGGEGYVKYMFLSGYTKVTVVPSYQHWRIFVALAGGMAVVAVYCILDAVIVEADTSIALRMVIGDQLPYAIMEGLGRNLTPFCEILRGVGVIIALIWSIPLFKKILNH